MVQIWEAMWCGTIGQGDPDPPPPARAVQVASQLLYVLFFLASRPGAQPTA